MNILTLHKLKIYKKIVVKCVVCYNICLFPIGFVCGYVIFGCSHVRHFKLINYKQFNLYYTKCRNCM